MAALRNGTRAPKSSTSLWLLVAWIAAVAAAASTEAAAQTTARSDRPAGSDVTFSLPLHRDLPGGASHVYRVSIVDPGSRVDVEVQQRGVRPIVVVYAPDDSEVVHGRAAAGREARATIAFIADAAGDYRLELRSEERGETGAYVLIVSPPRAPTKDERGLEQARRLLLESSTDVRQGRYDAALAPAERALAIYERITGPDDPLVAEALHAIARIYDHKQDYGHAEPVNLRALQIRERALGVDDPSVADTLYNLAWIELVRQDYARAEETYRRVLSIQERSLGPATREVTSTLNDLAILYHRQGDFDRAVEIDERVVATRVQMFGPDDSGVAKTLGNLGLDYVKKGDFAAAEERLTRALRIAEKAVGPDHPDVASIANNLGMVYEDKGDYESAERLHVRALTIAERAIGAESPEAANIVSNLAWVYQHEGLYEKAEPLFRRALAIREKAFGANHSDVGEALNNLAVLFLTSGGGSRAELEPMLQRAHTLIANALGADSAKAASILGNLGKLRLRDGDYGGAADYLARAIAIGEKALGPDHPNVVDHVRSLAQVYTATGDSPRATVLWARYSDGVERNLSRNLPIGSERQKLRYLTLFAADIDSLVSFHQDAAPDDEQVLELALTTVLRRKGRALDAMTDTIGALRARADADVVSLLGRLSAARQRLAGATLDSPARGVDGGYRARLVHLAEAVDALEADASRRSAEFRADSQPITVERVRAALPVNGALVEFAQFHRTTAAPAGSGPARYAAFVVRRDAPPRFVDLGDADAIDRAIGAWRHALRDPESADVRTLARAVDARVMEPVRAVLGAATHLVVSPDGALNLVPFDALVDENREYLVARFLITYVTSGRDLLRLQIARPLRADAVVVADPAFGDPAIGRSGFDDSQMFFGPLPGAAGEARALRALLPRATFLTRDAATKSAVMALHGPRMLHVATHGFFLEDPASGQARGATSPEGDGTRLTKAVRRVDNPLLRSGLALAGANNAGAAAAGVLTALEAADLDLWGTKLVVMSACDTGVGEVKTGDGVYGLRRAFVLAGSETQVMSLWPVSDRGTRDVMVSYYRSLLAGGARGDALRQAQLKMLRDPATRHPYYWAGFIVSGQWAALAARE